MNNREKWDEIERLCLSDCLTERQKVCLRKLAEIFIKIAQHSPLTEEQFALICYGNTDSSSRINSRQAMVRLRRSLASHYGSRPEGEIFVLIPRLEYRLAFSSSRPSRYLSQLARPHKNRTVGEFWEGIIGPGKPSRTFVVFPSEQPAVKNDRHLYTGTGEVFAAYRLAQNLAAFDLDEEICPSHSFDDSQLRRDNRLFIFVGSSLANTTLRRLRYQGAWRDKQRYIFTRIGESTNQPVADHDNETVWRGAIMDTRTGKDFRYDSQASDSTEYDYGLIAVSRIDSRCIVAMEGISTIATFAAAEYMLTADGIKEIRKAKNLPAKGAIPSFELLFRVELKTHDNSIANVTLMQKSSPPEKPVVLSRVVT